MKIESTTTTEKKRHARSMRARSSHYNSQRIEELSELFKHHALLKNYLVSFCFIISLVYRKHYLQRGSLCFSVYRVLMIWLWTLHEVVSWSKLQASIHLQDRALRDSFFAVLLLKSECTVLFIVKVLLQEELWDMLRVSFWSAHLDRACCFHLTSAVSKWSHLIWTYYFIETDII